MILSERALQRIKDAATVKFKNYFYTAYSPELQTVACTILALQDYLESQGIKLDISLDSRLPYQSVDED